jgi:hypothetical protein
MRKLPDRAEKIQLGCHAASRLAWIVLFVH